jgi:hypothetical protein
MSRREEREKSHSCGDTNHFSSAVSVPVRAASRTTMQPPWVQTTIVSSACIFSMCLILSIAFQCDREQPIRKYEMQQLSKVTFREHETKRAAKFCTILAISIAALLQSQARETSASHPHTLCGAKKMGNWGRKMNRQN